MMRTKKFLALLLALAMVLGLSTTAFAATEVSNTQDPNVLTLTSTGNTVTYTAVTVEGDPDNTGTGYADVTTYSYYIMLPADSTSLSSVAVTAQYSRTNTLKVDGVTQTYSTGTKRTSTMTLDFSSGSKVFEIYNSSSTLVRKFIVSAGISGETLAHVTMRINLQNAYSWIAEGNTMDATSAAGLEYLKTKTGITVTNGVASDMGAITLTGLPAGSTAMDALYYICGGVADNSGVRLYKANGAEITSGGLGIDLDGTPYNAAQYTYIAAMGSDSTDAWLGEFSTETLSGWLYLDRQSDGTYDMPDYGAAQYNLVGGEDIVWLFTNEFGDYDILW